MPIRLCLFLMLVCASAGVAARELKFDSSGSGTGSCSEAAAEEADRPARDKRAATPARQTRARPGVQGDSATRNPRWHSFLPGMFR